MLDYMTRQLVQLVNVVQHIQQAGHGPRLHWAAVVALGSILVGKFWQPCPGGVPQCLAMCTQYLMDPGNGVL